MIKKNHIRRLKNDIAVEMITINENDYNNDQNCNSIFGNPNDEKSVNKNCLNSLEENLLNHHHFRQL